MNSKLGGRSLRELASKLRRVLQRGRADQSGAAAVFFAVTLLLLAPLTLGLVDVYMATTQRGQLQDALDTATLYVARSTETDAEKIKQMGYDALIANLNLPAGQTVASYSFVLVENNKIVSSAAITPPSFSPSFWEQDNLKANSEVTRNSVNLEVAIVLDTTGSMSGQMDSLKTAAKDLVDLVVQDVQTPYYSKASLVPYSAAVKVGDLADTVRGPLRQAVPISTMTMASQAVVTTTDDHNLIEGEKVYIPSLKLNKHGGGSTTLTNSEYTVTLISGEPKKFKINLDTSGYKSYNNSGAAQCVAEGCQLFSFTSDSNTTKRFWGQPCVTERTGTQAYTDASPSTALVGRHYAGTGTGTGGSAQTNCKSAEIIPLTSTKQTLKSQIDTLTSDGFTAGHIGLAWGWYTVSPSWNGVFTGSSAPAAYDKPDTVKVVVLMTDGAFNTAYCKGVIAANSTDSGNSDQINCNATNGTAFAQAASLCANMKAQKVVLYTVGFNVSNNTSVKTLLQNCATSPSHVYLPSGGTALKDAFKAIGQDINKLRISK